VEANKQKQAAADARRAERKRELNELAFLQRTALSTTASLLKGEYCVIPADWQSDWMTYSQNPMIEDIRPLSTALSILIRTFFL
jgi:hypothetical protein